MGAPKGNEFWKQRSKHGKEKIWTKPEYLWDAAQEYFQWCENNPLIEIDFKGKDADKVEIPKMRAFTWMGLEIFLDMGERSLRAYKSMPEYKEYHEVIARIEKIMYNQKFSGAAAGFLNPNIIARDLGLTEKKEIEHSLSDTQEFEVNGQKIKFG